MAATPIDLYAFGSKQRPRPPRIGIDIFPDTSGVIAADTPPHVTGASLFGDPLACPLAGHYHRLAAGIEIPAELGLIADGIDVDPNNLYPALHHSLFAVVAVTSTDFVAYFNNLPWQYVGKK